jgi:quercetin dioxygenase-like cupin family protein
MNIATVSAPRTWILGGAGRLRTGMMLLMRIERWDVRRDGPLSQAALEHKLQALGYEPMLRTYPAGTIAAAQTDTRERIEAVVSGLIKVTIDGESAILTAGDIVFIPRGAARRLEVVGSSPAYCLESIFRAERA